MSAGVRSQNSASGHAPLPTSLPPTKPTTLILLLLVLLLPAVSGAAVLTEVRVSPGSATLAPGETRQFFATAFYDDGSSTDITPFAEWSTGDSRKARVSEEQGTWGLVTARDPGTVEVRARFSYGNETTKGIGILTIDAGPIVEITTRPSSKNLDVGIPEQFRARATYANGYVGDVSEDCIWSSSNPALARVDSEGVVTPLQPTDEVTIWATHAPTGLRNSAEDGRTRISAEISYIDFDPSHLHPNLTQLGAGMVTTLEVYAYRVDGTRSRITRDMTFQVIGAPSVIEIYEDGESDTFEAGQIKALGDGFVTVSATDQERGLRTENMAVVMVWGVLEHLEIRPAPFTVGAGEQRTPKVIGVLTDGIETPDLRKEVVWSIGNDSIAVVGQSSADYGKVTGVAIGETTLTATEPYTGVSANPVEVKVRGGIVSLSIEPAQVSLGRGMRLPLRAYGNRSDGTRSNITQGVTWEISPASAGEISSAGIFTALSSTTAIVRATLDAGTDDELTSPTATVSIGGTLEALRLSPTVLKVNRDQTRKAKVFGDLSDGTVTSDLREVVDWSVANNAIARVGNVGETGETPELDPGEVLGISAGRTTLTATDPVSGLTASSQDNLRVQGEITSLELEAGNDGIVLANTQVLFKARATFGDGSTSVVNDRCEWRSGDDAIATVGNETPAKGVVTGLQIGERTSIYVECYGLQDSARVRVAGDLNGLAMDPKEYTGKVLRTRRFRVAAKYQGGARGDATESVDWSSTQPTVASVENTPGKKGRVSFLSDGETFIVAVASTGHVTSAKVTVSGNVASIRISPNSHTLRGSMGKKLKVVAELTDGDQRPVTNLVTWTSSDEEIARISDRPGEEGTALTGAKTGTATLTALLPSGESASADITVDSVLVSLSLKPTQRRIQVGKNRRVLAKGIFDDGRRKTLSRFVEFISDDPTIAVVQSFGSKPGRVIGVAPGTTTVRAVDPATGIATTESAIIQVIQR